MARLVVGLGSAFGDDQLGWQVIDSLSEHHASDHGLVLMKARRGGVDVLEQLERLPLESTWHVILVDAVLAGGIPGTVYGPERLPQGEEAIALSSHSQGITALLPVLSALGMPIAEVTLFGIEPDPQSLAESGVDVKLSEAVQRAWPQIMDRLDNVLSA